MSSQFGKVLIQHAGIHVHNIEETVKWYHDILGFEAIPPKPEREGVFPKCILMRNGTFYLEIYEVLNARPFDFIDYEYTVGVKHLSFYLEDLDGFMDWLHQRGDVKILVDNLYAEEFCRVPGGDRAVYIQDNNGMLIELQKVCRFTE